MLPLPWRRWELKAEQRPREKGGWGWGWGWAENQRVTEQDPLRARRAAVVLLPKAALAQKPAVCVPLWDFHSPWPYLGLFPLPSRG